MIRPTRLAAALCLVLLALPASANAQVYRWKDADGKVHYGDRPPEAEKAKAIDTPAPAAAAAASEVQVTETTVEWFTIRGTSSAEMRASMSETAPYSAERQSRVWGQCKWWLQWDFKHHATPAGCRIGAFTITLNSRMKLPKWVDSANGGAELRARWETFEKRLRQHEDGHKNNGIKAANDLARRLRALPEHADCATLNNEIRKLGERIVSEYDLLDKAFDRVDLLYLTGFQ